MLTLFTVTGVCQIQRDQKAPDFTLPDLEGNNYQLSKNLGKGPVLINFWATWCAPCLDEMKALKPIYEKYKDRDLTILSISVDDPKTAGRVGSFVNSRKYPFKILMDTNNEIMQLYQTQVPPFSVLLDQDGKVVYTHTGYRKGDEAELDSRIEALLATR
jgi:peroxiredoxin